MEPVAVATQESVSVCGENCIKWKISEIKCRSSLATEMFAAAVAASAKCIPKKIGEIFVERQTHLSTSSELKQHAAIQMFQGMDARDI